MNRRRFLVSGAASVAGLRARADEAHLLLPSDQPDELAFRLMWFNPVPPLDKKSYRLTVKGLCDKPESFSIADLRALPRVSQNARMKCVQCWSSRTDWGGFRAVSLFDIVKPKKNALAVRLDCADKWFEYFTLEDLRDARVLFVLDMAGKPLEDRHGAPLRIVDPKRYGYKCAKLITSIEFVEQGQGSMACDLGPYYSPTGEIKPGYDHPLDVAGVSRKKIAGGEITDY